MQSIAWYEKYFVIIIELNIAQNCRIFVGIINKYFVALSGCKIYNVMLGLILAEVKF